MTKDDVITTIQEYDQWRQDLLANGIDVSPEAFVEGRSAADAIRKMTVVINGVVSAMEKLSLVLGSDDPMSDRDRGLIQAAVDTFKTVEAIS